MRRANFLKTMAFAFAATALPEISFPGEVATDAVTTHSYYDSLSERIFEELWEAWSKMEIRHLTGAA